MMQNSSNQTVRSLHRKLILPNIFITVVALIAAFSLFFGAWISVTLTLDEKFVSELADNMSSSETGTDPEQIKFLFKGVQTDITVSLEPTKMLKAGFAENTDGVRAFLEDALSDAIASVSELTEQMLPSMMAIIASNAFQMRAQERSTTPKSTPPPSPRQSNNSTHSSPTPQKKPSFPHAMHMLPNNSEPRCRKQKKKWSLRVSMKSWSL